MNGELHPETLAIRGAKEQTNYNEHNQALFITSSFMFDSAADGAALFKGEKAGFTYSRTANPTTAALRQTYRHFGKGPVKAAVGHLPPAWPPSTPPC